ncbi:MAG: sensor histidine kinase [Terriglobales bacterium]
MKVSPRLLTILSPLARQKTVERYLIAISAAGVAVVLRWCLDPLLGHVAFYATVYMAVAYCAVVCGWIPATLTALVGFFGIFYWFIDPRYSLMLARQIHGVIGFFLVSAALIWLGEANRRKQLRLNDAVVALTQETKERTRAEEELQRAHDKLEQRVVERTAELSRALAELESEVQVRKEAEDRLRSLSVRLMTLQDEERRRIARDLHDTTGQTFAALKMTLAALQRAAADIPRISPLLADLNALVDTASQEIRTTSYLLHPPLLDEAGIASAARWFVEGFAKRSGIEVDCDVPDRMERPHRNCELVLFRVLQESLTNVHRYSGASVASVKLRLENDRVTFEIRDNGHGIPKERLQQISKSGVNSGVGIAGMRERVRELGGNFEIQSDQTGTIVSVALPMPKVSVSTPAGVGIYAA